MWLCNVVGAALTKYKLSADGFKWSMNLMRTVLSILTLVGTFEGPKFSKLKCDYQTGSDFSATKRSKVKSQIKCGMTSVQFRMTAFHRRMTTVHCGRRSYSEAIK